MMTGTSGAIFRTSVARLPRQPQIGDDQLVVTKAPHGLSGLDRFGLADLVAVAFEQAAQCAADHRFVFNDEQVVHRVLFPEGAGDDHTRAESGLRTMVSVPL